MKPEQRERRIYAFAFLALVLVIALIARLAYLIDVMGPQLKALGVQDRVRVMDIPAPRGKIIGSGGAVIATNKPAFQAEYFDLGTPPSSEELQQLAKLLGTKTKTLTAAIKQQAGVPYLPVVLASNLTPQQITAIDSDKMALPGVFVAAEPLRTYAYGALAAHIVGHVGPVTASELKKWKNEGLTSSSVVGQSGLELQYQSYLQGTDGGEQVEVDNLGRPIKVLGTVPPKPGDTLQLSINMKLEAFARHYLERDMKLLHQRYHTPADTGTVTVMNIHTGQILAMVSLPSYDPNWFATGITTSEWKQLTSNPYHPLLNKVVSAQYAPGSTYKPAVALAALIANVITPNTLIPGPAVYWYPPYPHNWLPVDSGLINVVTAIAQSNDVFFYEVGRRTGLDRLAKYVSELGFGKPTGIDLPGEASGNVPTRAYEVKHHGAFYPAITYYSAIGQADDLATPIQLLDYTAQLADNGVRYRPTIVSRILSPSGKVIKTVKPKVTGRIKASSADWQAVHAGMHGATIPGSIPGPGGTAGYEFLGFPMQVAGKTGTAQVRGQALNSFFISYAPYKNPQIAVVVTVQGDNGEGASISPIARDIYDYYFHLNDPQNPDFNHGRWWGEKKAVAKTVRHGSHA